VIRSELSARLKQLDRIAVWIFDLDLTSAGAGLQLVAKVNAGALE
jgi:hypothetical protein